MSRSGGRSYKGESWKSRSGGRKSREGESWMSISGGRFSCLQLKRAIIYKFPLLLGQQ